MTNNLLSIIVPVYNIEQYIDKCITSLVNQTYKNIEIIIVNDGSTDDSLAVCNKLKNLYSCVKVLTIKNDGVSNARNIGLANATGEYIAFVDGDDWCEEQMFATLISDLESNNADIAVCSHTTKAEPLSQFTNNVCLLDYSALFDNALNNNNFGGYIWNKVFKRSLINRLMFDTNLHCCEDFVFVAQYLSNCTCGTFNDSKFYHYVYRADSVVNDTNFSYSKFSLVSAYEKLISIYTATCGNKYDTVFNKNFLKINLNFKGRFLIDNINDQQTYNRIQNNIKKYYKSVMLDKKVSLISKVNIALTKLFPKQLLQIKRLISRR